ncbi:hypothetical protein AW27_030290 [Streptomyces sp. PCS3-D2]|uniref:hypothetical protein n=1 Tax=Streptomyces sp. PCS3-D2 TaxID=1460244 RepID=UPI00044B5C37|nr:hypothetical protein [Streptomyces sp. PCS3-D2]WKV75434.1 hypothetical protein AW27_030290 [Streptomyces sp. PCS3-D2]
MNSVAFRISAASLIVSTAVLAGSAPAAFATTRQAPVQTAGQTADAVEKVTGTQDITEAAPSTVPATATGKVVARADDGSTIGIRLPATRASDAVTSPHGTVVYPNSAAATSLAVQPISDGGIRALIVINDASAPTEYRFGLDLPTDAEVIALDDGSAAVVKGDDMLGVFAAPWAQDANGRPVATSYRLEQGSLVQTVAFDADTAFPVVADPTWEGLKKRAKAALKNSNTSTVTGAAAGCIAGAITAAGAGCGPGAAAGAVGGFAKGAIEGFIRGH